MLSLPLSGSWQASLCQQFNNCQCLCPTYSILCLHSATNLSAFSHTNSCHPLSSLHNQPLSFLTYQLLSSSVFTPQPTSQLSHVPTLVILCLHSATNLSAFSRTNSCHPLSSLHNIPLSFLTTLVILCLHSQPTSQLSHIPTLVILCLQSATNLSAFSRTNSCHLLSSVCNQPLSFLTHQLLSSSVFTPQPTSQLSHIPTLVILCQPLSFLTYQLLSSSVFTSQPTSQAFSQLLSSSVFTLQPTSQLSHNSCHPLSSLYNQPLSFLTYQLLSSSVFTSQPTSQAFSQLLSSSVFTLQPTSQLSHNSCHPLSSLYNQPLSFLTYQLLSSSVFTLQPTSQLSHNSCHPLSSLYNQPLSFLTTLVILCLHSATNLSTFSHTNSCHPLSSLCNQPLSFLTYQLLSSSVFTPQPTSQLSHIPTLVLYTYNWLIAYEVRKKYNCIRDEMLPVLGSRDYPLEGLPIILSWPCHSWSRLSRPCHHWSRLSWFCYLWS